jgi:hypothetical protein
MTSRFTLVIRVDDVVEEVFVTDEAGKTERFAWLRQPHFEHIEVTVVDNQTQDFEVVEFPGVDELSDEELAALALEGAN